MKTNQHVVFLFVFLLIGMVSAHAGESLRIANSGDYPPYYFMNDKGEVEGYDVDISKALCKVMNVECKIVVVPWDDIITGLVANKYDAIVASMAKTPEREKLVDFTDCYSRSSASFVGDPNSNTDISAEGMRGKILGAVRGSYQEEYLEKNYKGIATIKTFEDIEQTMNALAKGEIDLVLDDSLVIFHFMKTIKGRELDFIGKPVASDDPSNSAYIAVRKGDGKLREDFDRALKIIRLDGTLGKIGKKYFPFSTY